LEKRSSSQPGLDHSDWAAATAAFGRALQQAAATPQGLHLHSCKLSNVDWTCTSILRQLAVNSLTSLELQLIPASNDDLEGCVERLAGVMKALRKLHQLRKLSLQVDEGSHSFGRQVYIEEVDPLLEPLTGLTNLTSPEVGRLWSLR
jgi:hypothetical protein